MRNKIFYTVILVLLIVLGFNIYTFTKPVQKIAFVRSGDVLQKYLGFREAQGIINGKTQQAQTIADSLYNHYVKLLEDYNSSENTLNANEKKIRKSEIENQKTRMEDYRAKTRDGLSQTNDKLIQGALNQINSYIKDYAENNNIEIVIGVTSAGNVLYGSDKIDITDQVIEGLNTNYKK